MNKIIVTSGQPFTDIDALACAVAYSELLNLKGFDAKPILPGPLNKTITKEIKSWNFDFETHPHTTKSDINYVLVDISEPKYFASFVKLEKIVEIYDHRKGFEEYWKEKLGTNSHVELVGACATLIWEKFVANNLTGKISQLSANLLYTAIASNTLNFKASVTTARDRDAFKKLKNFINVSGFWIKKYFLAQDRETDEDIENAIKHDTKNTKPIIAQLELWNAKEIISKHFDKLISIMQTYDPVDWFLTSPSISEGKNYLITKDPKKKKVLKDAIGAHFEGDFGTTDKLWLRKEIIVEMNKLATTTKN